MATWKLASPDYTLTLNLDASDGGPMNGTLTYQGQSYPVTGAWAASGVVPGRYYSVFSVSGYTPGQPDFPNFIAASGIMTGPGAQPTQIEIRVSIASSSAGTINSWTGVLLPWDGVEGVNTFDYVVVLMLENRSFDNLLGYMYPNGVPANAPRGKTFEGVAGKQLSNPVPPEAVHRPPPGVTSIPVSPVGLDPNTGKQNYFQPYPDPGETYDHINTQLFDTLSPPYNLPAGPLPVPTMDGFVRDYVANYKAEEEKGQDPTYDGSPQDFPWTGYKQIMQCYPKEALPVLTTLAEQFGVFDHWFCSVPSQTWCNRAFWNAGTSWGRVVNGPSLTWAADSYGNTIFNQLPLSNWAVYSANPGAALTSLIHLTALMVYHPFIPGTILPNPFNHFYGFNRFLSDCQQGKLPAYSFVEPRFFTPHNDMHPSTAHSTLYGKTNVGSVELGELYVWQVYDAIRNSPQRDKTLLIITFDEHGGCYDHVPPPDKVTAPNLTDYSLEDEFDFKRLGIRVPTIMVSSHIARNTVINTPMDHGSFMKTVGKKWNLPPLTARVADAPEFSEVFTSVAARPLADWPVIPNPASNIPSAFWQTDFSAEPLSELQRSIVEAVSTLPEVTLSRKRGVVIPDASTITNVGEALQYFRSIPGLAPEEPLTPDASESSPAESPAGTLNLSDQALAATPRPNVLAAAPGVPAPTSVQSNDQLQAASQISNQPVSLKAQLQLPSGLTISIQAEEVSGTNGVASAAESVVIDLSSEQEKGTVSRLQVQITRADDH